MSNRRAMLARRNRFHHQTPHRIFPMTLGMRADPERDRAVLVGRTRLIAHRDRPTAMATEDLNAVWLGCGRDLTLSWRRVATSVQTRRSTTLRLEPGCIGDLYHFDSISEPVVLPTVRTLPPTRR